MCRARHIGRGSIEQNSDMEDLIWTSTVFSEIYLRSYLQSLPLPESPYKNVKVVNSSGVILLVSFTLYISMYYQ